jgi:hypothetical protein
MIKFINASNASIDTLRRRVRYGGRKGRRAKQRLRPRLETYSHVEVWVGGVKFAEDAQLWVARRA